MRAYACIDFPCENLRKNSQKLTQEIAAENNKMRRKVQNDAELARNSRNYLQKIADLGQITKFVASYISLGVVRVGLFKKPTGLWKALREKCIKSEI